MEKLDLTKKYKAYYSAKTKPELIHLEEAHYLSITGKGDPSGSLFAEKIQALYSIAYAVKFIYKDEGKDFVVAKLEGLWWFDEEKYKGLTLTESSQKVPRSEWKYRLLTRIPEYVTEEQVHQCIATTLEKKPLKYLDEVEFYKMREGQCIQMLHVGPFDNEPESLQKMQGLIEENAFKKNGLHHEIYLSDFRRTDPEKQKTILREPVV